MTASEPTPEPARDQFPAFEIASQPKSRPTSSRYSPKRDRRRIIWGIMSLAIVLVAIGEARKPQNWKWLTDAGGKPSQTAPQQSTIEVSSLEADQVRIPAAANSQSSPVRDVRRQPDDLSLRIAGDLLDAVQDSRVGVRSKEIPTFFAMLQQSKEADRRLFEGTARSDLPFPALMNDPQEHRGEIVWVEGELRRLELFDAGENDLGFDQLYDGWLFTDEAGRTNPYRVVCTAIPNELSVGNEVRQRVRLPAYFFKRFTYATAHGQHSAPMFIGSEMQLVIRAESDPLTTTTSWMPLLLVGMTLVLGGTLVVLQRLKPPRRPQRSHLFPGLNPEPPPSTPSDGPSWILPQEPRTK